MEFLTNRSSFLFFILYLGRKNSHALMKFSDDTKSAGITNGKKACSTEDLEFLVCYLLLSVAVLQPTYQLRIWPKNYPHPCDI